MSFLFVETVELSTKFIWLWGSEYYLWEQRKRVQTCILEVRKRESIRLYLYKHLWGPDLIWFLRLIEWGEWRRKIYRNMDKAYFPQTSLQSCLHKASTFLPSPGSWHTSYPMTQNAAVPSCSVGIKSLHPSGLSCSSTYLCSP